MGKGKGASKSKPKAQDKTRVKLQKLTENSEELEQWRRNAIERQ